MSRPKYVHLLPERDRMMAETHKLNADGSNNPTGIAASQDAPHVISNAPAGVVAKVVEAPEQEKPAGQSSAATKGSRKKR